MTYFPELLILPALGLLLLCLICHHSGYEESRKYFKRGVVDSGLIYNPTLKIFPVNDLNKAEKRV